MRVLKVLTFGLLLKTGAVCAQNVSNISAGVDIGAGVGGNGWAPSIAYHEEAGTQKLPWLRLGLGFRTWGYYAGRKNLETTKVQGVRDYLEYRDISVNGLSFMAGITLAFPKVELGVNTDLLGLTFGSKRHGFYEKTTPMPGSGAEHYNQWLDSSPTIFNAVPLVLGRNSGQSEAFIRFWPTSKIGIKLGYLYGRVTYTTEKLDDFNVYLDNRQRHVSTVFGLPYAALSFPIAD